MCRLVTATLLMAAVAAPAFGAQDRYGPPSTAASRAAVTAHDARPEPLAPWARRLAANAPAPVAAPPAPPRPQPLSAWAMRQQPAPVATRLPPPPAGGPQPLAYRPAVAPAPMPAVPQTAVPQAVAAAPRPSAMAPGATGRPRLYSVSRQYGEEPDRIPVTPPAQGQVLNLAETPVTRSMSQGAGPLEDIPISETSRNAAASRATRLGL